MKYIQYDGASIMTSDCIAEAVADYAAVLGANGKTDTIHVPTADRSGMRTTATLLVGPSSQIAIEDAPDDELEPDDDGFVDLLRRAAEGIDGKGPVNAEGGTPFSA